MEAVCAISGGGASTAANRWRAQLYYCGTTAPCNNANLPRFNATSRMCGGALPCNLVPDGAQDGGRAGKHRPYVGSMTTAREPTLRRVAAHGHGLPRPLADCWACCAVQVP